LEFRGGWEKWSYHEAFAPSNESSPLKKARDFIESGGGKWDNVFEERNFVIEGISPNKVTKRIYNRTGAQSA